MDCRKIAPEKRRAEEQDTAGLLAEVFACVLLFRMGCKSSRKVEETCCGAFSGHALLDYVSYDEGENTTCDGAGSSSRDEALQGYFPRARAPAPHFRLFVLRGDEASRQAAYRIAMDADDLPLIVDAPGQRRGGAGKVDSAIGIVDLKKSVNRPARVDISSDDPTRFIDVVGLSDGGARKIEAGELPVGI